MCDYVRDAGDASFSHALLGTLEANSRSVSEALELGEIKVVSKDERNWVVRATISRAKDSSVEDRAQGSYVCVSEKDGPKIA